jgi:hypothetical protein
LADRSSAQSADPTSSTSASVIAVDLKLAEIDAISVTAYIEQLGTMASKPTIKTSI